MANRVRLREIDVQIDIAAAESKDMESATAALSDLTQTHILLITLTESATSSSPSTLPPVSSQKRCPLMRPNAMSPMEFRIVIPPKTTSVSDSATEYDIAVERMSRTCSRSSSMPDGIAMCRRMRNGEAAVSSASNVELSADRVCEVEEECQLFYASH